MGPSSNSIVVFIRGEQTQETGMQREDRVKTIRGNPRKAEMAVMCPQAKDCQHCCQHLEVEQARKDPPLQPSGRAWPYTHPDFVLLASRNRKGDISIGLNTQLVTLCCGSHRELVQES